MLVPVVLAGLVSGCGGEAEVVPGPASPPPSTAAATATLAPTATATATAQVEAPKPSLADLQRQAVKTLVAAFNARDAKQVASVYGEGVVSGSPGPAGWMEERGKAAVEEGHKHLFAAFPDMKWGSGRVFVKGEVVIQEWVSNATHQGDVGANKAAGKPTGMHGVSVYWFDPSGLITKDDTYYDSATLSKQTGATPGAARPIPEVPAAEPAWIAAAGSPEEAKKLEAAKAMYAAFGGADEKAFAATLHDDVVQRNYRAAADVKGAKAAVEGHKAIHKAFPDMKITVPNAWAFGDKVVAEVVMNGTHNGDFGPVKATKKAVTLHSLDVVTVGGDGKITLLESYSSQNELLGQIGKLDAAKKAAPAPKK